MGHRAADQFHAVDGVYTRLSIFLIIGLCLGSTAVAWVLRLLLQHVRAGGRVSVFIVFLLLSVILELFLIPFIVGSLLFGFQCEILKKHEYGNKCSTFLIGAFIGTRLCGLCFHQLVALEGSMSLRPPCAFTRLSSPFFSIPICLTVWICSSTFIIHPTPFVVIGFILFAVAVIAAVLTCVVTFKTFQSHSGAGETSYTVRGTGLRILVVAMGSLWLLYFPFFVWFCVLLGEDLKGFSHTASMFVCIMGFRVVGDPLLCLLVWRENTQRQA